MRFWLNNNKLAVITLLLFAAAASPALAQSRIDQLSAGAAVSGTDTIPNCQACGSAINAVKTTFSQVLTYIQTNVVVPISTGVSGLGTGVATALGTAQGNGNKVQLSTGAATSGKCVEFDANGNTVVAVINAACGGGGGGSGTVTNPGNLTTHAPLVGGANGTTDAKAIAAMTNGQIPIGSTGADPVPGVPTAATADVQIGTSAGGLNFGIYGTTAVHNADCGPLTASGSYIIAFDTPLTAPRSCTLPAASSMKSGQHICFSDVGTGPTGTPANTPAINGSNTVQINRAGSDTIGGLNSFSLSISGASACVFPQSSDRWGFLSYNNLDPTTVAFLNVTGQTYTGGIHPTAFSNGTASSGTKTIDCGNGPIQSLTDGGAFTLAMSANDGSCVVRVTNNGSAGTITFSGFSEGTNKGDALTTTNTQIFDITLTRIGGNPHYLVSALQ